jgi:truncated hemoglobin YjbI
MTDLSAVLAQLKKEKDQLDQAIRALSVVVGGVSAGKSSGGGKRIMSAAARKRIAEAQRARWAKIKAKGAKKAA